MKKIVKGVTGAGLLLLALSACSYSTQPDQVAVAYNDGIASSRTFDKCIPVSTREVQGPNDVAFAYPANQRVYDFTGRDGSDAQPFQTVSSDGVRFRAVPGTLYFNLETGCKTLRIFHEKIGNRYHAYFDGDNSIGWSSQVLPLYIGQPLATAIDRSSQKYTWRALYNDPATKAQWEKDVLSILPTLVNNATEGDEVFFKNFSLTLQIPVPPQDLLDAIEGEQAAVAQANSQKARAEAQVSAAEAQARVAQAEARARAAEVQGYGGIDGYLKAKAVDRGINPWQPSYGSAIVGK